MGTFSCLSEYHCSDIYHGYIYQLIYIICIILYTMGPVYISKVWSVLSSKYALRSVQRAERELHRAMGCMAVYCAKYISANVYIRLVG